MYTQPYIVRLIRNVDDLHVRNDRNDGLNAVNHQRHKAKNFTVNRQTTKTLTVSRQKGQFLPSTVKKQSLAVKRFQGLSNLTISAIYTYISCSSRTAGSQRIVLTGRTSFRVPKYTYLTVFSTYFPDFHLEVLPVLNYQ